MGFASFGNVCLYSFSLFVQQLDLVWEKLNIWCDTS